MLECVGGGGGRGGEVEINVDGILCCLLSLQRVCHGGTCGCSSQRKEVKCPTHNNAVGEGEG